MAFGCEMNHSARSMSLKQAAHQFLITDVTMNKLMAGVLAECLKIGEIAGVGEPVQVDDRGIFQLDPAVNKVRPDKSRAAGHDDGVSHKKHLAWHLAPILFT